MLKFFRNVLATIVGMGVFFLLFFVVILLFVPDESVQIKDNAVLRLRLSQPILERSLEDPLGEMFPSPLVNTGLGLVQLKENIKKAKNDKKIKGILLDMTGVQSGIASLQEIRESLEDFKKSEKFVYAYGEVLSEGAYYLASLADKVYLNPSGEMEFNGFTAEISFYKKAMEKLEVEPMVFRVGDFKSAVEPYILDKMSDENREQINSFLNSIHDELLSDIAKSRKIDKKELEKIADESLVQMPEDAKKYKLVDKIAYFDDLEKEIKKELELKDKDKVNYVTLGTYDKVEAEGDDNYSSNRVAVIIAAGEIRSGKSEDEAVMGSATIVKELRKARQNKRVKAVVLRINSPGGSALASDVVWKEIQLTRKEKPVIASMSDYAASGGYYLAMGCDKILAKPTTITGSIGVFLLLFDVKNLFENKLGITTDRVSTGNFPELRSALLDRELKEEEKAMLQASADKVYDDFTKKAAEGRAMSQDAIKAIASGRVWTGTQAKANGLVDELGGLEEAIALAAKEAELDEDDYRVRYYPTQKSFVDKLLDGFQVRTEPKISKKMLKEELGVFYPYYELLDKMKEQAPIQARIPFELQVK